jgi:hypothetical protein
MAAPHLISQVFDCTKLQLLDSAFAAPEFARNFANAVLVDKSSSNHMALVLGQAVDELPEERLALGLIQNSRLFQVIRGDLGVLGAAFPPMRDQVRSDAEQPREERSSLPLESRNPGQSLMKDFGGDVFRFFAGGRAARHERIDTIEVGFVKLGEAAWVTLRGFDHVSLGVVIGNVQV